MYSDVISLDQYVKKSIPVLDKSRQWLILAAHLVSITARNQWKNQLVAKY